ncbi:hypothetical protein MJK72_09055 [Klebsiella pneumoniae]|nr:hypothetical protein MJK72_09055 [Klebsiella pneumoniae]
MSEAEARPTNFLSVRIIDEDLATGKHTTVHTRFPPEPNGYSVILAMQNPSA